jgi:hypothetical protein
MYKGTLKEFYLTGEGRISYLILIDCSRFYMYLDSDQPKTGLQIDLFKTGTEDAQERIWSYLAIDGSQISNVLFDKVPLLALSKEAQRELDEMIDKLTSAS